MKEDRVFVRDGRRHHRRTYSRGEVRAGAGVVVLLTLIAAWVVWRGAHPDPALFAIETAAAAPALEAGRGPSRPSPLPLGLAPPGWQEGRSSDFDAENLYVKVNGRADFYRSFGFQHLWVVALTDAGDATRSLDIEVYDQGSSVNAIGTWQGERSPEAVPELGTGGVSHIDRNALFLTRGRYYVRAIASAEDAGTRTALLAIRSRLERELPGDELPWSYALFAGRLGVAPGAISYQAENAFSFAFAREVHVARFGEGETELFVVRAADAAAARELARRFAQGFREMGTDAGNDGGIDWSEDRYLATISGAASTESFVAGVRGAASREAAKAALAKLVEALSTLPLTAGEARAQASAPAPALTGTPTGAAVPGYPGGPEGGR